MPDQPSTVREIRPPRGGMLCPVCGVALLMTEKLGIEIDYCPTCRGIWLDRGEIEKIVERSLDLEGPGRQQPAAAPSQPYPPQPYPAQSYPPEPYPPQGWGGGHGGGHHGGGHGGHGSGGHHGGGYGKHGRRSWLRDLFD